jgi:hypothetical protein
VNRTRSLIAAVRPHGLTAVAIGATVGAWLLYAGTLAPGLTWAHHGADGGDLLAAALTNGVPHPSGYPVYTLLLQGWLAGGHALGMGASAWLGNLFSAWAAGLSVGVTVLATAALLPQHPRRILWALVAGLTWALTPLLWSQALITEVYAFHALLITWIGLVTFARPTRSGWIGLLLGLGLAHHLTTVLLWPALVYGLWARGARGSALLRVGLIAATVAALAYLRIPLVAGQGPPPVNWGYAVDWTGFWWLVSGQAYRGYLFALSPAELAGRILGVGRTLVEQVTPIGLIAVIAGAMQWERTPDRRMAALLWALPVSLYAAAYATVDSQVYLLPVVWLVVLWLALGLAAGDMALDAARHAQRGLIGLVAVALIGLALWRGPALSLRHDDEATRYLAAVSAVLPPGSLVISSADAPTFALWYGAWGGGKLAQSAPDTIFLNAALFEFGWYRRLMHDLYPQAVAPGATLPQIIAANRQHRPVFFTEPELASGAELVPVGPLWQWVDP